VGLALEGEALAAALEAEFEDEVEEAALRFLAIRHARRALLPAEVVAYEDGNEWNEGLAEYVEYRLFQALEEQEPVAGLEWAQGFHGFADLSARRAELITRLRDHMSGRVNVNNDPYGTAPARFRLYFSGMALGALLDRVGVDWHERALEPDTTLTGMLAEHYDPDPDELAGIWEEVQAGAGVAALCADKEALRAAGQEDNERLVRSITDGPGTCLVLDHSALAIPGVGLAFTPFGVRAVDDERTVYTQIPLRAQFGQGNEVRQTVAMPLLQEKRGQRISFRLQEAVSRADLAAALGVTTLPEGPVAGIDLALPGATLTLKRATIEWLPERIVLHLLP